MDGWIAPLIGALAGMIAGSFLGVLAERWPRGEQVVKGRSRCDSCGKTLGPHELVPVISYVLQSGKCRRCGAAIPDAAFVLELGAALIGALVFALAEQPLDLVWLVFGLSLLLLAVLDLRQFWLPDRVTLPLLAIGLAFHGLQGDWLLPLAGAAIGWALLTLVAALYRRARKRDGLGGGDPKLLAAIGAWLGPGALSFVLLFGSGAALVILAGARLAGREVSATTRIAFGAYLALGAFSYILMTILWRAPPYGISVP